SVADQVEKHLGQALLIAEANWKRLVYGSRKRELLVLGKRLRGRAHRLDHTLNRVFAHVEGELPGFDLGDIKDCIYQAQQVLAVGSDAGEGIERFRSLWLVEAFLYELGIPENGRERGPELVAHVGHELVLVLACDFQILDSFGKLPSTLLYLLEQPRVFNRDYGLVSEGIDELNLTFC